MMLTNINGMTDCSEIKENFRSPTILPTLFQIEIKTTCESFSWHTSMKDHADKNYRRTPPPSLPTVIAAAATIPSPHPLVDMVQTVVKDTGPNQTTVPASRLVGIELNPGPPKQSSQLAGVSPSQPNTSNKLNLKQRSHPSSNSNSRRAKSTQSTHSTTHPVNHSTIPTIRTLSHGSLMNRIHNAGPTKTIPKEINHMDIVSSYSTQLTRVSPGLLLKDMIHLVDSYLNNSDWISSMHVCHHWLLCFASSPSRDLAYPVNSIGVVPYHPSPRLLHHFTSIKRYRPSTRTTTTADQLVSLTPKQLSTLSQQLPYLTNIAFDLRKSFPVQPGATSVVSQRIHQDSTPQLVCPQAKLRTLRIDVHEYESPKFISTIFQCQSITSLTLIGLSYWEDMTIFEAIPRLVDLLSLTLCISDRGFAYEPKDLLAEMKLTHLPEHLNHFNLCYGSKHLFCFPTLAQMTRSALKLEVVDLGRCEIVTNDLDHLYHFAPNLLAMNLGDCDSSILVRLNQFESLRFIQIHLRHDRDEIQLTHDFAPQLKHLEIFEPPLINGTHCRQQFHGSQWLHIDAPMATCTIFPDESSRLAQSIDLESLFSSSCVATPDSWTQLSYGVIYLYAFTDPDLTLDGLRNFPLLESVEFTVLSGESREIIYDFFESSEVMPQLQRLSIRTNDGTPPFEWVAGQIRNDHYRRTQPPPSLPVVGMMAAAATTIPSIHSVTASVAQVAVKEDDVPSPRLVGIEVNPGPPIQPSSHKRTPNLADLVDRTHSTKKPRGTNIKTTSCVLADTGDEVHVDESHQESMSESEIDDTAEVDHTTTTFMDQFPPGQEQLRHAPATTTMDLTIGNSIHDGSSYSTPVTQVVPGRLLKDMIHLINSYLDDTDWISSMLVNHHWLTCGASSSSRHLSYPINENGVVRSTPPLRLLHHFTSIKCDHHHFSSRATGLTPTLLITLFQQLPYLTDVTCEFEQWEVMEDQEVNWPHQLYCLDIDLPQVNTKFISSIFNCHTITTLKLIGIRREVDPIIFQSLNQLIHLRILVLYFLSRSKGNKPIDLLSMMDLTRLPPHLNHFNLNGGYEGFLDTSTLANMVQAVELDEIDLSDRIQFGPNDLVRIHQFAPNLKQFHPPGCHPSHLSLLSQFHRLQHIHLQPPSEPDQLLNYEALLTDVLASTTQLTSIHFDRDWLPTSLSSWQQLSRSLIHLTSLECTTSRLPDLNLFTSLLTLTSLILHVFSNDHDHDDQAIMRHYVHQFFQSQEVMPNLKRISLYFSYGDPAFEWRSGQARNDHYRCSQPSAGSSNCTDVPAVHLCHP